MQNREFIQVPPASPRRRLRRGAAIAALTFTAGLLGACAAIPEETPADPALGEAEAAASAVEAEQGCRGVHDHHAVALSWEALADGAPLRGGTPVLVVKNSSAHPVSARLTARFFADGSVSRVDLGKVELGEDGVARVPVRLDPAGASLARLEFAAQVVVDAELYHGDRRLVGEGAPPLFFHEDPTTREVLAYGEADLWDRFNAGDFRRLRLRDARAEGVVSIGHARKMAPGELSGDPAEKR